MLNCIKNWWTIHEQHTYIWFRLIKMVCNEFHQDHTCTVNAHSSFVHKRQSVICPCYRPQRHPTRYTLPFHTLCHNGCESNRPKIIYLFYVGLFFFLSVLWMNSSTLLSKNNWNRRANARPSCGSHVSSTLALRPAGLRALNGLSQEKTWSHISLFHPHRKWDQWATDSITLTATLSNLKSCVKCV